MKDEGRKNSKLTKGVFQDKYVSMCMCIFAHFFVQINAYKLQDRLYKTTGLSSFKSLDSETDQQMDQKGQNS